jgi:hypothetical protein
MATDCVIYAHFSDEDFTKIMQQTPNNCDVKKTLQEYRELTGPHDHFVMNITANKYEFVRVQEGSEPSPSEPSSKVEAQTS